MTISQSAISSTAAAPISTHTHQTIGIYLRFMLTFQADLAAFGDDFPAAYAPVFHGNHPLPVRFKRFLQKLAHHRPLLTALLQ